VLIAEMDGSMLPVVETVERETKAVSIDRRKTRQVGWKEARLALAHPPGSVTPIFGATLGSVEEAGERLAACAQKAGAGTQTKIHGVGDGAAWIMEQMEAQFGSQAQYLIDFYHVCDYLAAAAEVIAGKDPSAWIEEKMDWLKDNRWQEVLEALRPSLELATLADSEAPVRACFRYISNHSRFLDYEWPSLCVPEPTQDRRQLVEDREPKKDDRSPGRARQPRLGRLLERGASGSCIMTRTFNYTPAQSLT
jgi:hypothetical protein